MEVPPPPELVAVLLLDEEELLELLELGFVLVVELVEVEEGLLDEEELLLDELELELLEQSRAASVLTVLAP